MKALNVAAKYPLQQFLTAKYVDVTSMLKSTPGGGRKKEQRISHVSDVYFHHHTNLHLKPLQYGKLTVDEHKNSDIFRF